jgi:hypothetical protein
MDEFKKILLPLLAVFAVIIFVGVLNQKNAGINRPTVQTREIKINGAVIKVKIADTEEKRKKGLSGIEKLNADEGMLFVFESKDAQPSFWMKDMLIAIDLLWLNDGKVVQIEKNILPPKPATKDEDLKLYRPETAIDYVLEVNAGFCEKNSIRVGQTLSYPE